MAEQPKFGIPFAPISSDAHDFSFSTKKWFHSPDLQNSDYNWLGVLKFLEERSIKLFTIDIGNPKQALNNSTGQGMEVESGNMFRQTTESSDNKRSSSKKEEKRKLKDQDEKHLLYVSLKVFTQFRWKWNGLNLSWSLKNKLMRNWWIGLNTWKTISKHPNIKLNTKSNWGEERDRDLMERKVWFVGRII